MLHTVVECVLGYSRVVNNLAAIIALQTAAMEEVESVLRGLPTSRRDKGHVSHAKIFLLSDGPGGDRCVLTGSANFSTSALLATSVLSSSNATMDRLRSSVSGMELLLLQA